MKKICINVVSVIYLLISMFTTICLLSYNEFNITQFNNKMFVIVENNFSNYKKGDLLIIKNSDKYKTKDKVVYYDIYSKKEFIKVSKINDLEQSSSKEYSFVLDDGNIVSEKYVFGKTKDIKKIPFIGHILYFMESKVGYFVFVILPLPFILVYEFYTIIKKLKEGKK